jgi:hypothetical protein
VDFILDQVNKMARAGSITPEPAARIRAGARAGWKMRAA